MKNILNLLVCPHCGTPLSRENKSLRCDSGHSFDVAKAGYVNLLPPGKEKNARTGDERDMVKAREEFLSAGHYAAVSDALADAAAQYAPRESYTVCDMGCGEGYHTCRFAARLAERTGAPVTAVGFDASKYAAERGCKRAVREGFFPKDGIGAPHDGRITVGFLPGNLFHLPLADHSVNVALSMFAPVAGDEARRILTDDGILIVVSSGRDHLLELRGRIYDDVRLSNDLPPVPDGFAEIARISNKYQTSLPDTDTLKNLFTMTPFYYKTTEAGRERLFSSAMPFEITVDVNYSIFKTKD
ncbi:MAG: methyltransferase domain-containing protein [Clostridia bacterium]|nr:methyltransferase domain-containing protein [Clostridia bacterium]